MISVTVSCITEMQTETSSCVESAQCDEDDEGEVSLHLEAFL